MDSATLNRLKALRKKYKAEGFIIIGFTGSSARGDDTCASDIDLVYEVENPKEFAVRNGGFGAFSRIAEIRSELEKELNNKVDLIAITSLNEVGRKYILKDMKYVGQGRCGKS
ncbi:nucleotidyltransferase family protein [Geovibrio ferrireducens]|uniref:nucleotidyltransferase family protein n=1 Tax=Geovibrio ferrireducens TaxID=46201 RepID=UPI002245B171|nr:nucleotidyltransferase domain-containing protein [Geovibrio ferrireducens]